MITPWNRRIQRLLKNVRQMDIAFHCASTHILLIFVYREYGKMWRAELSTNKFFCTDLVREQFQLLQSCYLSEVFNLMQSQFKTLLYFQSLRLIFLLVSRYMSWGNQFERLQIVIRRIIRTRLMICFYYYGVYFEVLQY